MNPLSISLVKMEFIRRNSIISNIGQASKIPITKEQKEQIRIHQIFWENRVVYGIERLREGRRLFRNSLGYLLIVDRVEHVDLPVKKIMPGKVK